MPTSEQAKQIIIETISTAKSRINSFSLSTFQTRGGSFVQSGKCPDNCPENCCHIGEPLNANGKRERLSGPENTRVSRTVSSAANFGGLIRMLKTTPPKEEEFSENEGETAKYLNNLFLSFTNFIPLKKKISIRLLSGAKSLNS